MGVKYYDSGEHPSGFIGFRVTVAFDDDYRQKYFSTVAASQQNDSDIFYRYQRLRAEKQNLEWQMESILYQYHRFVTEDHPTTKPERGVGVHGITANFIQDRRGKWQAVFLVARDQEAFQKRRRSKEFTFRSNPYSEVWQQVVDFWAQEHNILAEDKARVLHSPPAPEQFKRLRRLLNAEQGWDIPVEALSPVFREQREKIARERALQRAKDLRLDAGAMKPVQDDIQAEMTEWFQSMTEKELVE